MKHIKPEDKYLLIYSLKSFQQIKSSFNICIRSGHVCWKKIGTKYLSLHLCLEVHIVHGKELCLFLAKALVVLAAVEPFLTSLVMTHCYAKIHFYHIPDD